MSIFPTINLPPIVVPQRTAPNTFFPSLAFDFEAGEFLFDNAGRPVVTDLRSTFEDWCIKVCTLERNTRRAYSDKLGCEYNRAMKEPDPEAVKSSLVRTITEALMVHPLTEWVRDFTFQATGDELQVSFQIKARLWQEPLEIKL